MQVEGLRGEERVRTYTLGPENILWMIVGHFDLSLYELVPQKPPMQHPRSYGDTMAIHPEGVLASPTGRHVVWSNEDDRLVVYDRHHDREVEYAAVGLDLMGWSPDGRFFLVKAAEGCDQALGSQSQASAPMGSG